MIGIIASKPKWLLSSFVLALQTVSLVGVQAWAISSLGSSHILQSEQRLHGLVSQKKFSLQLHFVLLVVVQFSSIFLTVVLLASLACMTSSHTIFKLCICFGLLTFLTGGVLGFTARFFHVLTCKALGTTAG